MRSPDVLEQELSRIFQGIAPDALEGTDDPEELGEMLLDSFTGSCEEPIALALFTTLDYEAKRAKAIAVVRWHV